MKKKHMKTNNILMLSFVAHLGATGAGHACSDHDKAVISAVNAAAGTQIHAMQAMEVVIHGDLEILAPMIRSTPPNAPVAAGYMLIRNTGSEDDRLIGGDAPFAGRVEIHEMAMDGDVMRMREIDGGLVIPAGGSVLLERGGLHVMFMQLDERMVEGEQRQVTLNFEKAGEVTLAMPVKAMEAGGHQNYGHGHNRNLEKVN